MDDALARVEVRGVSKSFGSGDGRALALTDVTFELLPDQITAIIGPNGCGKTTLLRIVGGLEEADSGEVVFAGLQEQEPRVGMAFQDFRATLLPWRNCTGNVMLPLEVAGFSRKVARDSATQLLRDFGVARVARAYPYLISGGEAQAVSTARALIAEPDLLLVDEPFSALDYEARSRLAERFLLMWERRGKPVCLLVSHDFDEAILLSHRIIILSKKPARVVACIENTMSWPRSVDMRFDPGFAVIREEVTRCFLKGLED